MVLVHICLGHVPMTIPGIDMDMNMGLGMGSYLCFVLGLLFRFGIIVSRMSGIIDWPSLEDLFECVFYYRFDDNQFIFMGLFIFLFFVNFISYILKRNINLCFTFHSIFVITHLIPGTICQVKPNVFFIGCCSWWWVIFHNFNFRSLVKY